MPSDPIDHFPFSFRSRLVQVYLLLVIICISILSFFAYQAPHFAFDLPVTLQIQSINNILLRNLMSLISWIGYNPQVEIITLALISLIFYLRFKKAAYIAAANAVVTLTVSMTLKNFIQRNRPTTDLVQVFKELPDYGFPSGHVLFYTSFFGFIFYLVYLHMKPSLIKKCILLILGLLIILIAPSRIFLGAHWASDTLASYLLGSILLLITINFYNYSSSSKNSEYLSRQPAIKE